MGKSNEWILWKQSKSEILGCIFHQYIFTLPSFSLWGGGGGGVRVCGDAVLLYFWCGFSEIFILSCGIAVLQNQAVCGFQKCSSNSTAVSGFLMLFCALFIRNSVQFCGIRAPPYAPLCELQHLGSTVIGFSCCSVPALIFCLPIYSVFFFYSSGQS